MIKKLACLSIILSLLAFSQLMFTAKVGASTSSSDVLSDSCSGSTAEVCKSSTKQLDSVAIKAVEILIYIVGVAAIGFIIYGGILYATSAGKPDTMTKAKKTIMGAVIGLAVALLALGIVVFVKNTVKSTASSNDQATASNND